MADGSLLIGRITDTRALTHVREVRVSDTSVRLSGRIAGHTRETLTPEHFLAIRDQILGLANNTDEPFVPMVFEKDPTLTQMVRVRSAEVSIGPGDLDTESRTGPEWELELDRVGNTPNIESTLLGGQRQLNATALIALVFVPAPVHARPTAALDYYDGATGFTSDGVVRETATGNVSVVAYPTGAARHLARWSVAEDHWYDGAALIEQTYPDGDWYPLVGRRPHSGRDTTGFRISNGNLQVVVTATGTIQVQAYSNGAWGTAEELTLSASDGAFTYFVNRVNTWAVRRNSPEQVIVRLTLGLYSGANYAHRVTLDLSLRRGSRMVHARMATAGIDLLGKVETTSVGAGTTMFTSGANEYAVRTDSADAQGNRFVLCHAGDPSSSLNGDASGIGPCNVSVLATRARAWSWAAGFEIAGASAVSIDTATAMVNQWAGPLGERTTVVGW